MLAVWILNVSIDAPDPESDSVKEDLTYNDVESISELVFEYCLGWENFVPEHDENDRDGGGFVKKIEIVWVLSAVVVKMTPSRFIPVTEHFFEYTLGEPEIPFIPGAAKPPQA